MKGANVGRQAIKALGAIAIALTIPLVLRAQQGGTTRYVYDNNGRLVSVISPTG